MRVSKNGQCWDVPNVRFGSEAVIVADFTWTAGSGQKQSFVRGEIGSTLDIDDKCPAIS